MGVYNHWTGLEWCLFPFLYIDSLYLNVEYADITSFDPSLFTQQL